MCQKRLFTRQVRHRRTGKFDRLLGANLTRAAFAFWFVNFKQYAICRLNLAVYLNFTAGSYFTLGITHTFTKLTKFDLFFARILRSHDEALWQAKFLDHFALFCPHLARVVFVIVAQHVKQSVREKQRRLVILAVP